MYIDLLIQLKNAQAVKKESIKVPYSKMDEQILGILEKNDYIDNFEKKGRGVKRLIDIKLKYETNRETINGFKLISKPSRRIYIGYREIKPVKGGYGLLIISTPKGVMTAKEAKRAKMGGEALFEIW